jgi:membrane protein
LTVRSAWQDLREGVRTFIRQGGRLLGAGIAFYSMLSVAPIFVLGLHVAGLVTREEIARGALLADMARWVGEDGARTIGMLVDRARVATGGTLASALSIAILVYASTRLFSALERSIDVMWGVEKSESPSMRDKALHQLRKRSIGLGITFITGAIILMLVGVQGALGLARNYVPDVPHLPQLVEAIVSFSITTTLFMVIFLALPSARISLLDALIGAVLTAALFTLGSHLVASYVTHKDVHKHYGDAGTVVMLLLWVQYSAQIFLIGAAFTGARARRRGTLTPR